MRPTVEDLQAIWLFTYSRSSLLEAVESLAELDTVAPESPQYRALIDAAVAAYARPFTVCLLPPKRKRVVRVEFTFRQKRRQRINHFLRAMSSN
jgi:hypothetical protein